MNSDEAKRKLIDAALVLDEADLGDFTRGHISVRDPANPSHFFMKPHSRGLDEVDMENIVVCDLGGAKIGGGGRRHSEVFIHSEVFKARPEINAVIHAHPKHAVALSVIGRQLQPLSLAGAEFADGVGIYQDTIDLIRTPETGARVAEALGNLRAAFLRSHGVVVVGKSLEESVILAITLENACEMQLLIEGTGVKPFMFPLEEIRKVGAKMSVQEIYDVNFDYLVRKARRRRGR